MSLTNSPDGPAEELAVAPVSLSNLAAVRGEVAHAARNVGIPRGRAELFTVAVNEIVINALEHGREPVTVFIYTDDTSISVRVHDHGNGQVILTPPNRRPPADQPHGRGLWLTRTYSDTISFHSSDAGTLVSLGVTVNQ